MTLYLSVMGNLDYNQELINETMRSDIAVYIINCLLTAYGIYTFIKFLVLDYSAYTGNLVLIVAQTFMPIYSVNKTLEDTASPYAFASLLIGAALAIVWSVLNIKYFSIRKSLFIKKENRNSSTISKYKSTFAYQADENLLVEEEKPNIENHSEPTPIFEPEPPQPNPPEEAHILDRTERMWWKSVKFRCIIGIAVGIVIVIITVLLTIFFVKKSEEQSTEQSVLIEVDNTANLGTTPYDNNCRAFVKSRLTINDFSCKVNDNNFVDIYVSFNYRNSSKDAYQITFSFELNGETTEKYSLDNFRCSDNPISVKYSDVFSLKNSGVVKITNIKIEYSDGTCDNIDNSYTEYLFGNTIDDITQEYVSEETTKATPSVTEQTSTSSSSVEYPQNTKEVIANFPNGKTEESISFIENCAYANYNDVSSAEYQEMLEYAKTHYREFYDNESTAKLLLYYGAIIKAKDSNSFIAAYGEELFNNVGDAFLNDYNEGNAVMSIRKYRIEKAYKAAFGKLPEEPIPLEIDSTETATLDEYGCFVAKGSVENISDATISSISIEYTLYDTEGYKITTATAYIFDLKRGEKQKYEAITYISLSEYAQCQYEITDISWF